MRIISTLECDDISGGCRLDNWGFKKILPFSHRLWRLQQTSGLRKSRTSFFWWWWWGGDPRLPLRPFSLPPGCSCPTRSPQGLFQEGGSDASNLHILKDFFFFLIEERLHNANEQWASFPASPRAGLLLDWCRKEIEAGLFRNQGLNRGDQLPARPRTEKPKLFSNHWSKAFCSNPYGIWHFRQKAVLRLPRKIWNYLSILVLHVDLHLDEERRNKRSRSPCFVVGSVIRTS